MAWKRLCAAGAVAEDSIKRFDVDGVPVVLVSFGDEYRAMPPMCPHEEEPLEESGVCAAGVLTCAEHLWQWSLADGKPAGPEENDRNLLLYPVRREGDDLMVQIDSELTYQYDKDDEFDF